MNRINRTLKAFTLAEVLITLLVIGIIASLTVPALLQNLQDAQLKAAFKKEYSVISAAYSSLVQDNAGSLKGSYNSVSEFANALKNKLNYIKYCSDGTASDCLPQLSQYKYLDNTIGVHPAGCSNWVISVPPTNIFWAVIVLADGADIIIPDWLSDCNGFYPNSCVPQIDRMIVIDVNGTKGPNIMGKDLYQVIPYDSTVKPAGLPSNISPYDTYIGCDYEYSCADGTSGSGCAAKVLKE